MSARELDPGLWVFDRGLRVYGLDVGARMTAVRLGDGSLFLHSPVALDAGTRAAVDALGPVRHVVAPNRVHHLFVAAYREAYPDATLWAAPGLADKKPRLPFDRTLPDTAPPEWEGELDQLRVAGMPYLEEVVFLHRASRTLLLTDLAMNFGAEARGLTGLWLRAMGIRGRFGLSRMVRLLVRDRAALRESLDRILAWDFERVVVSHGVVLQRSGRRLLREVWSVL